MAVVWSQQAADRRVPLFLELETRNPQAAVRQDDAIGKLVDTLDELATYQRLPDGTHFVPVQRYRVVILYDRDPVTGDALVLDLAPSRSDWRP